MGESVNVSSFFWRLLILCTFTVGSGVLSSKGFFCRDPDTGTLYPVNSTWESTSFCGKYTCKLRRKTHSKEIQSSPQFIMGPKSYQNPATVEQKVATQNNSKTEIISTLDENKLTHVNKSCANKSDDLDTVENIDLTGTTSDGDRYLTEEEITALSLLLKLMKKSDLQAILEVYNLAQDIYKDIDKTTDDNKKMKNCRSNEQIKSNEQEQTNDQDQSNKKKVSYWYDPLMTNSNIKGKIAKNDTKHKANKPVPTTIPFYNRMNKVKDAGTKQTKSFMAPPRGIDENSYFKGPLSSGDFRKLPYYHQVTNVRKQSSYANPMGTIVQPIPMPISNPVLIPSNARTHNAHLPDYPAQKGHRHQGPYTYFQLQQYPPLVIYPVHSRSRVPKLENKVKVKESSQEDQIDILKDSDESLEFELSKILGDSVALLDNYNVSDANSIETDRRWSLLQLNKKDQKSQNIANVHLPEVRNERLVSSEGQVSNEVIENEQENFQNIRHQKMAEWQTPPLSITELNDVKANIGKSKYLPFPFRKRIKIERVGNLMEIDDMARLKRNIKNLQEKEKENGEEYEAFIEKLMCATDTAVPAYYKMGNESALYPACCPQRLQS